VKRKLWKGENPANTLWVKNANPHNKKGAESQSNIHKKNNSSLTYKPQVHQENKNQTKKKQKKNHKKKNKATR